MLGLEDGSILVDGYCGIMDMAWEKPAKVKMLASRYWYWAGRVGNHTYERSSDVKAPKPRNFVYAVTWLR